MEELRSSPPCPPYSTLYYAKPGDTMFSIARAHGIPLNALLSANPSISPDAPGEGQAVCIPYLTAPTYCPPGFAPYEVVAGDTMQKLALRHGMPLSALLDANPLVDADSIRIGQVICVPQ
jgi:LysM repeat protein